MSKLHLLFVTAMENSLIPTLLENLKPARAKERPRLLLGAKQLPRIYKLIHLFAGEVVCEPSEILAQLLNRLFSAGIINRVGTGSAEAPHGIFESVCTFADLELISVGRAKETREISHDLRVAILHLQREYNRISDLEKVPALQSASFRKQLLDLEILVQVTNGESVWFVAARCFEKFSPKEDVVACPASSAHKRSSIVRRISPVSPNPVLAEYRALEEQKRKLLGEETVEQKNIRRSLENMDIGVDSIRLNEIRDELRRINARLLETAGKLAAIVQQGNITSKPPAVRKTQSNPVSQKEPEIHPALRQLIESGQFTGLRTHLQVLLIAHFSFEPEYHFAAWELTCIGRSIKAATWSMYVHSCCFENHYLQGSPCSGEIRAERHLPGNTTQLYKINEAGRQQVLDFLATQPATAITHDITAVCEPVRNLDPRTQEFSGQLEMLISMGKFSKLSQVNQSILIAREFPLEYRFSREEFIALGTRANFLQNWAGAFRLMRGAGVFQELKISPEEVLRRGLPKSTRSLYLYLEKKEESRDERRDEAHPVTTIAMAN